jgi:hypothetical protein
MPHPGEKTELPSFSMRHLHNCQARIPILGFIASMRKAPGLAAAAYGWN